jgi:DNA-binding MarR family transcriptional regulator
MKPVEPEGLTPALPVDRLVHEPGRLMIMRCLYLVEQADFVFLMRQTGMTQGNLSSHLNKLETGGYVEVEKTFRGKRPRTMLRPTEAGRAALEEYRRLMGQLLEGIDAPVDAGGGAED